MNNATTIALDRHQFRYARHIVHAVLDRKEHKRMAVIAIEVALTESQLKMYANSANPDSIDLPHDAVGFDNGSVGLFQQQVGGALHSTADWGTTKELMDPEISTAKFLDALAGRTNWQESSNWVAAQDVQNSAYDGNPRKANNFSDVYGGNYEANDELAAQIVNAIWSGADVTLQAGGPDRYWVDTFQRAPVFANPGSAASTGVLYRGRNYVYGKRWGAEVKKGTSHNHWWLKTDPDEGSGSWVSAFFLSRWGDDEARDNAGNVIPSC